MATKTKEETMKSMDAAQDEAHEAITGEQVDSFKVVAKWWGEWYRRAGHKRLARLLLSEFKDVR